MSPDFFGGKMSNSKLVDSCRTKDTLTENGALTNSTTLNANLDLFFAAGACRTRSDSDIRRLLSSAFSEDAELALKTVFWAGDIRGGAGERRFFKIALNYIKETFPETFVNNIDNVPFYNRWDSLFQFANNTEVLTAVRAGLSNKDGLLAKWMPREGKAANQEFRKAFCKFAGLSPKKYRKLLTELSSTIEQQLSAKKFNEIEYKSVPSVAFNKYRKSFYRNDEGRFNDFISSVEKGEAKINAGAIFPHDIYRSFERRADRRSINAQWSQLPNYLEDSNEKILPVCDVSGSMNGTPMEISIALGIYLSERNNSIFKDAFVTFSANPQMQYLKGDFCQRAEQLRRADWGMNTNLTATFDMVLNKAKANGLTQDDMPTSILIISDMEFDNATRSGNSGWGSRTGTVPVTNFEAIKEKYENAGYEMPKLIFWNVDSRNDNFPISQNDEGVALVSGASPSVVKSVLSGRVNPLEVMIRTVKAPRYDKVKF